MKREELRKLGLTDEQLDSVMNIHGDDMNAQKATINQLNEQLATLTTERDGLKAQVTDRDKDIAGLKKNAGDNEALTQKLTDLQSRYDTETSSLKKSLEDQARDFAIEGLFNGIEFTSALARKAAIAEFKASNPEFKEGKFTDADGVVKKLKEQHPDAFKTAEPKPEDKPDGAGGKKFPKFTQPLTQPKDGDKNPFDFKFTPVRNTANAGK